MASADENATFAVARHGYDRTQVHQFIQQLEHNARRAAADRDEARAKLAELSNQLEAARGEIATLSTRLDEAQTVREKAPPAPVRDEQVARVLALATSQASEITSRAQASADHTWSAAEQASAALRDRYQRLLTDLERQHDEIHGEHETLMSSARKQVEEMTVAAQERRQQIDDEAEAERDRIEREFEESIGAKRAALQSELDDQRAEAELEAEETVRTATQKANATIATANEQLRALTALRVQVAERLRSAQKLINQSAAALEPLAEEADLTPEEEAAATEDKDVARASK